MKSKDLARLLQTRSIYEVMLVSKPSSPLRRFRVRYAHHAVALQERRGGAAIQIETGRRREDRRATDSCCWVAALAEAESVIRHAVYAEHRGGSPPAGSPQPADPPISAVIDYYVGKRFGGRDAVSANHARKLDRIFAIIQFQFGLTRPVSFFDFGFVDRYVEMRTSSEISFPTHAGRRPCGRVKQRTAVKELKDFSGVIEYAVKKKELAANPLAGYNWESLVAGDRHAVEHYEEAHTHRYALLMARPKLVDPEMGERLPAPIHRIAAHDRGNRARCILAFLFHHGHRYSSVVAIDCGEIARTADEVRALLARTPNHREWWADHYPYGGVLWGRSKAAYLRFTPFSRAMRREIDRWAHHHPDWRPGIPLFPQLRDKTRPITYSMAHAWVRKATAIVRSDLARLAVPQSQIERWLSGAPLHGYRDHWATIMDQLGYGWDAAKTSGKKLDLHNHVAFCGDWAVSGGTQAEIYAKLNPGILQAIVEFERAETVYRRFSAQAVQGVTEVMSAIYGDGDGDEPEPERGG